MKFGHGYGAYQVDAMAQCHAQRALPRRDDVLHRLVLEVFGAFEFLFYVRLRGVVVGRAQQALGCGPVINSEFVGQHFNPPGYLAWVEVGNLGRIVQPIPKLYDPIVGAALPIS